MASSIFSSLNSFASDSTIKTDGSEVLLNPSRRRNYDRVHRTLCDIGILRAHLGLSHGNNWGSPVSVWISHGAYILFPHGNVVNRFVSAVNDVSNMGYGLMGGTFNAYHDIIDNKLNVKIGAASALSNVNPQGGGNQLGFELNGRISWTPQVYMNLELHAAKLWLGDFYDSPRVNGNVSERPANPWTVFLTYKWLMF